MENRSYGQPCPVARGLDVVGERWTLLVVRELLLGPKRFKDLLAELPAMGTNRLSDRLKSLEQDGVIEKRTLPPPGEARVYALTDEGERLRPLVICLAAWGINRPLDERIDPRNGRPATLALVLCGLAPAEITRGVRESYEFRIADRSFHVLIDDGEATPRSGPAPLAADVTVECDLPTLLKLVSGQITPARAHREGHARIHGSTAAIRRAFKILSTKHLTSDLRVVPAQPRGQTANGGLAS
jgi:DNA-binding HxlR family transcriptional regulator/putative sterol carrier protein